MIRTLKRVKVDGVIFRIGDVVETDAEYDAKYKEHIEGVLKYITVYEPPKGSAFSHYLPWFDIDDTKGRRRVISSYWIRKWKKKT